MTENQRVLDAVEALKHNDLTKLGELMGQSHESMRDEFRDYRAANRLSC